MSEREERMAKEIADAEEWACCHWALDCIREKYRAEAAESALTTARIDGARAFAEWCECREPSWNVQSVNGDFIAGFDEALARWLASERKEGK